MKRPIPTFAVLCAWAFTLFATLLVIAFARAETSLTPKAQFTADSKAALTQYESDKKLCNDETTSSGRLQCRRDAKAQYDQALAGAKARMAAASAAAQPARVAPQAAQALPLCAECGKVVAVSTAEKTGEGSPLGLIAGGAAGAILGHQVGSGSGKDLATIAGAVGGAYAGKKIEEKVKTHTVWNVTVEFEDGSKSSYQFDKDPGFKVGDPVRKSGASIAR